MAVDVDTYVYNMGIRYIVYFRIKNQFLNISQCCFAFSVNQLNEAGDGSTWHGSRGCGI